MNKKGLFCFAPLLLFAGCATDPFPSAGEILNYPEETGRELVYGTGFENPEESTIEKGEGFCFAPGEGNNGNTGLRGDRVGEVSRVLDTVITLPQDKIVPGAQYRVMVSVKGKDLRHVRRPIPPGSHRFMEIFYTDAKTGAYSFQKNRVIPFAAPPSGEQFQSFSCTFPGIEGAKTHVRLALWYDFLGTIWFDDLRVYREGVNANAFLVDPAYSTFFTDSGHFRIRLYLPGEYSSPVVLAEFLSGNTPLRQQVLIPADNWILGDFGENLPTGEGKFRITLADSVRKLRIKTVEFPVNVRIREELPEGACTLDSEGFLLKDGKRFLPLGLFFSILPEKREEHLKRISASPYNFICDYTALSIPPAQNEEKITAFRKGLDLVRRHRLKIIVSLLPFYSANSNYVKNGWSGETSMAGMTCKLARSVKDHPALMGWYLADELSAEQLAVPIEMRRILNREDPFHPTFTLTNLESELPDYAHSGDILMFDPYPLRSRKGGSRTVNADYAVFSGRGRLSGTPIWAVPQGFNWGIEPENLARYGDFIDPSEEDMRTLMMLSLVEGAKGICLFNYPYQFPNGMKRLTEHGLQNYPDELWRRQVRAGSAVKKIEPYFISSLPVPEIRIENRGRAEVKARLWKAESGKSALVIVGTGGGPADAIISAPGCGELKSEFGHTKSLGGGLYHFTSEDLASDMLFDKNK